MVRQRTNVEPIKAPKTGKAARRSAKTIANKARKAETRAARFLRAAERRTRADWIDPETGKRERGSHIIVKREEQARRISAKRAGISTSLQGRAH